MNISTERGSDPLVDIIVPVFNEEKYLSECIESILRQSYTNWQLTIVNNKSSDRSLEISEEFAHGDGRITVVTTPEFFPQLRNHNFAMDQISADSKYCKVVLGDNWIFPNCLQHMVEVAEANPTVGVVSGLWLTSRGVVINSLPFPSTCVPGRDACRAQLYANEDYFGSPTMVMYRSDLVRSRRPFFRESARSPDVEVCYELLMHSDFSFIHQILSFNRTDNISVSTAGRTQATFALNQYMQILRFGSQFLAPDENMIATKRWEHAYYAYLAERALRGASREFWTFHRNALKSVSEDLRARPLLKHLLLEVMDILLNPKKTLSSVVRTRFRD